MPDAQDPVMQYWYNGALISSDQLSLSVTDPGLLYGATVFTTLRVYGQSRLHPQTQWTSHRDRLQSSLDQWGWNAPDWHRVERGVDALIWDYPVLRITLFPDGREWIVGRSLPLHLEQWQQDGIVAWVAESYDPTQHLGRSLPVHKTGNYLAPWLARQQAQQRGAQEAILTDGRGTWLETSTGNLWGWGKGMWWTPPIHDGILPGVMRSHLITFLKCHNETICEEPWTDQVIQQLEAIAYSNSVVRFIPIHTILRELSQRRYNPYHPQFSQIRRSIGFHQTAEF
jgi:4-amino-4-deoxychorismate lyase